MIVARQVHALRTGFGIKNRDKIELVHGTVDSIPGLNRHKVSKLITVQAQVAIGIAQFHIRYTRRESIIVLLFQRP